MCDAFDAHLLKFKYRYIGRHMAATPFKFPLLFREPKNVEILKRLGVRAVVVASSNNFFLALQDTLNPDLRFIFGKMQVINKYSRFSRFLLLWQYYSRVIGLFEMHVKKIINFDDSAHKS